MTLAVAWLWQGLAITALAAILVRAMPRLNAATRHVIWWLALGCVLMQPWTKPWTAFFPASAATAAQSGSDPRAIPAAASYLPALHLPAPPDRLLFAAFAFWGGVVCFNVWRIAAGVRQISRLKHGSRPMSESRQERLPLWSMRREQGRRPELRVSDTEPSPCALGLGRPVILIPARLAQTLADHDLDLIVTHEHAHLARYDDWLRLLQCCLVALGGIHPAVRLIAGRIDLEREAACDDRVVAATGDPRTYAECLATVAGLIPRIHPAVVPIAPHAVRSGSRLRARVIRLLDHRCRRSAGVARRATIGTSAALLLALFASDYLPPLVIVGGNRNLNREGHIRVDGTGGGSPSRVGASAATPVLSANWASAMFTMLSAAASVTPLAVSSSPSLRGSTDIVGHVAPAPADPRIEMRLPPIPLDAGTEWPHAGAASIADPPPLNERAAPSAVPIDSRVLTPALSASSLDITALSQTDPALDGSAEAATLVDRGVAAGLQVKRLGQSVGQSSRVVGTSVGRFFGRAGKSIAANVQSGFSSP